MALERRRYSLGVTELPGSLHTIGTPLLWLGFLVFVLAMLALDLGVFHRKAHHISWQEAGIWSAVWVFCSVLFALGLYLWFGSAHALEFTTGYLIEKALAVDNIFVIAVVFSYFRVPDVYQHRVLFWGILGALLMRAGFIGLGAALLARFHWVLYVFGALLVFTGVRLIVHKDDDQNPGQSWVVRTFRRVVPMTEDYREAAFVVRENGRWLATPLLLALVVVEVTDVIFALDSIPAIFAVTEDPFIVFTSNIFAILGLRAMYFLLAGVIGKFRYLKYGLAGVLCFVGVKMLIADLYKIPIGVSLGVVALLIGGSVVVSAIMLRRNEGPPNQPLQIP